MNKRKNYALNKLFNFCMVLGLLVAFGAKELLEEKSFAWGLGFGVAALLIMLPPAIFTPYCYAFDGEGISLCYIFLPVERYLWKDIYAIEVEDKFCTSHHLVLIEFFYENVFSIKGANVGKNRFYMTGHVRKSFRTKHLFEKYWDGTITGYLFEDVKKWVDKRRAKKQAYIKSHLTDEVVSMEREIRSEVREWLSPFAEKAKLCDLDIKASYVYITHDFDELNSRPDEGYTYTLVMEIAHFNETDENRIVIVNVDLLYVRLGKISYRGVKNKNAKEELESSLSTVLDEISKIGIDTYCAEL